MGSFLAPDLLGGAKNFMIGSLIEEQFKGNAGQLALWCGGLDDPADHGPDHAVDLCARQQARAEKAEG